MSRASKGKTRIDQLLVDRGLAPSRARAQALVMAGVVRTGDVVIKKAGDLVDDSAEVWLASEPCPYVSRGGLKLASALDAFAESGLHLEGRTALDVGASTGGFTDCLLTRGVARVFAVDVGYGQLAEKLRRDPRVDVRERTNARWLKAADFPVTIDLVVVDASFIGLGKLLPAIAHTLCTGGALVALIKPQFEAGRDAVSRGGGVIRDAGVRDAAIAAVRNEVLAAGFQVVSEVDSAVAGPKGNVERFVYALRTDAPAPPLDEKRTDA